MKRSNVLLTAALTGLLGGTMSRVSAAPHHNFDQDSSTSQPAPEKHSCAGKNSCKGTGGCATDGSMKNMAAKMKVTEKHACSGKNSCKGNGGCATDGSVKQTKKAA